MKTIHWQNSTMHWMTRRLFVTNINLKMILLNTKEKQTYVTPSIMVVEVKIEGVICTSPGEYPQWSPEDI